MFVEFMKGAGLKVPLIAIQQDRPVPFAQNAFTERTVADARVDTDDRHSKIVMRLALSAPCSCSEALAYGRHAVCPPLEASTRVSHSHS